MEKKQYQLIIIGSGPAGLTAGIYAARARLAPLIVAGPKPGGQLMGTTTVENWPGHKSIQGPDLMRLMREHAQHAGCSFLEQSVERIDASVRPMVLYTSRKLQLTAQAVIVCSGAVPRRLQCPGEDVYWGKGVTTCAVCDAALYQDKNVVVVGGGDTAMESVLSLAQYTQNITLVQILDRLTASETMQERVAALPFVRAIFESTIASMAGSKDKIERVTIKSLRTGAETELETDGLFLAIGQQPNTAFLKGVVELNDLGYVRTFNGTRTSVGGIFAAGDVMDGRYCQAITSAGTGCMAALDAERYVRLSAGAQKGA